MIEKFTYFSTFGVNGLPRFGNSNENTIKYKDVKPFSEGLTLYIHIPYCKTICPFCKLGAVAHPEVPEEFVDLLIKEAELVSNSIGKIKLNTIYFGGGTPSLLKVNQLERIFKQLNTLFSFADNIENSIEGEAISLNDNSFLSCLKELNFQRVSFGVQTFDKEMREHLGRKETISELFNIREKLAKFDFKDVNIDCIYNLPGFDEIKLQYELEMLDKLDPTSIEFHPFKYTSCTPNLLTIFKEQNLYIPNATDRINTFNFYRNWALKNNFREFLYDFYTKSTINCQYMGRLNGLHGGEYISLGIGARSYFGDYGFRNTRDFAEYKNKILSGSIPTNRTVFAPLVNNFIATFGRRGGILNIADILKTTKPEYLFNILNELKNLGYVTIQNEAYQMTNLGINWYQNIQEALLTEEQKGRHIEHSTERSDKLNDFEGYFSNLGKAILY